MSLPPSTTVGPVALTVANLDRALAFYTASLGLLVTKREPEYAELGSECHELLQLTEDPKAERHARTTGLYHFAVLLPSRLDLAQSLRRLVETDTPLQGAADHLVRQAIYLADPEGNGIEIYHDRPRATWPYDGGSLRMATDPLDLQALLSEAHCAPAQVPSDTKMGHVHLH